MNAWLLTLPLLVGGAADPVPADQDVRPGWIALVTVLLIATASVLLWFSMRKQIRRIRVPREDEATRPDGTSSQNGTGSTGAAPSEPRRHDS